MPEDTELLRQFLREKSGEAFAALVQRYLALVYAVALRQAGGDAHLAEDIAQQVFADLARKAPALAGHPTLAGWLYRSTHFAASRVVRIERRRKIREQKALAMDMDDHSSPPEAAADWERLRPTLDAAIAELNERDRDAVALRFFQGCSFAEVGARLNLGENAARMRVERALDRLHRTLARRGVTSTAAALGLALADQAVATAPAGLAASIAQTAAATATGGAGIGLTFLAMGKIKTATVGILLVAGLATAVVEVRANRALRAGLAGPGPGGDLVTLQSEQRDLETKLRAVTPDKSDVDELARLRARLAQLKARPPGVVDAELRPVTEAGRGSAEAASVSMMAAMNRGDLAAMARMTTFRDDSPEVRAAFMASLSEGVRARYPTPEQVVLAAMYGSRLKEVVADPCTQYEVLSVVDEHPDLARKVRLWVRQASGRETLAGGDLQPTPDGWAGVCRPLSDPQTADLVRSRLDPLTGDPVKPKN